MARKRTKTDIDRSRNALGLTEQAFHLLRTAPLSAHCWCYLGMVPFAVGLLFFATEMSRGAHAEKHLINAALGIALIYLWMKICQAVFCRKLWMQLSPGRALPPMTISRWIRYGAVQIFIHAFAPVLLLIGLLFLLPLGWVFAFFQNVTVFGFTINFDRRALRGISGIAMRQSHFAAMQNHMVLAVLKAFALFTWLNVILICAGLPWLAKILFGIESVFTQSWQAAYLNSTFLSITVIGAWFVLSPFTKAIYVVRCFEGVSEKSGADLVARLETIQQENAGAAKLGNVIGRSKTALTALMCTLFGLVLFESSTAVAHAQDAGAEDAARVQKARETLDQVMSRPEFEWRMPREERGTEGADKSGNVVADWIVATQRAIGDFISDAFRALQDLINPPDLNGPGPGFLPSFGSDFGLGGLTMIVYILLAVLVALLIGMLVVFLVRRHRDASKLEDDEPVAGSIDLEREELLADELPEDEWLQLAREKVEQGEPRLAVRALFLASLAHLAGRSLLRIVKSKSNRDYRRELIMKARGQDQVLGSFSDNVRLFECVWYGSHEPTDELLSAVTKNYEQIKGA